MTRLDESPLVKGNRNGGLHRRARRTASQVLPVFALVLAAACSDSDGGGDGGAAAAAAADLAAVRTWNRIAIDATGLDHMPSNQGPPHTFGQQVGPCRAARAEAIVHIAIFEVVNAIQGGYESYVGMDPAPAGTSLRAGVAQAARDTLVALYPSQSAIFDVHLNDELAQVPAGTAKTQGITLGQDAASAILLLRANDGSNHPEPLVGVDYFPGNAPGEWRPDPVAQQAVALGANWSQVLPFVMTSAEQFRLPPPPALDSPEYAAAYNEVVAIGGDGTVTPTTRTADQTHAGIYWAYDGVPSLCAPPRLYNQIAVQIATERGTNATGLARLLAILNVAMADAGLGSWESKYFYKYWRPVCGIREADAGTGPSGLGDDNPATSGDTTYLPLCAPASNLTGTNFTPPFPAYPSGHATFGGSLFQVLRRFYGTNDIPFTFVSDEYNGVTTDNTGAVRPLLPRSFSNLSEPEEENGQSRIYLGIHWSFDKTGGIQMGNIIGNYVYDHAFQPVP